MTKNCSAQFLASLCRFQLLEYVLSNQYGENILLVIFATMKKITVILQDQCLQKGVITYLKSMS